jgi:DNA topoisomerase-1
VNASQDRNTSERDAAVSDRQAACRKLARKGRLRYVADATPGFTRRRHGRGFLYLTAGGSRVRDRETLRRINDLAIPPAWTDVWICPHANGHLQATGFDDRGRKQYLYHSRWREVADQVKFERLREVGRSLPRVRRKIAADLRQRRFTRNSVVAAMVRLLDASAIRIGSAEYRRDNGSYGLTTLERRHVTVSGDVIRLDFRGKGGVRQQIEVRDPQLARILRHCRRLSGRYAFQYRTEAGVQSVSADDVNQYLNDASAGVITAKDFRTWQASVCVAAEFAANPSEQSGRQATRACKGALTRAAALLGNTVTVCRKYYVHTGIVDAFCSGEYSRLTAAFAPRRSKWLARDEQLLMHVLRNVAG